MTASSYIQQLQISARNKNGSPINPQQAMLLKLMPAFFAVISLTLPAGVVVYFLVSNLYRIAQQSYITRAFYREDHKHDAEAKADPRRRRGGQAEARAQGRRGQGGPAGEGGTCPSAAEGAAAAVEGERKRVGPDRAAQAEVLGSNRATRTEAGLGRRERHRWRLEWIEHDAAEQEQEEALSVQWVETTGKTVEEALDAALDRLGVGEDDAEWLVLEEPRPGLFGRLRGEARLRVRVRPTTPRPKVDRRDRKRRSGRDASAPASTNGNGSTTRSVGP